ncbi:Holliday junction resolvase RecU [Pectinatus frisingensis]|uniref:Holliday junction resolvase RecU n=1 Tax=Pectinatus frisingensis TaxID=865 RepID=UPI0018C5D6EB|nr:Holliday junction resolvase RecU [Pectinatus frisingensis]
MQIKDKSYRALQSLLTGRLLENEIDTACRQYALDERAVIYKTPESFRCINKKSSGRFTGQFLGKAQPDYQGTLKGGKSIVFEAKFTDKDRINKTVLTKTQFDMMQEHSNAGAAAYICCGIVDKYYMIPFAIWADMKDLFGRCYITQNDIIAYQVKMTLSAVMFLDYLHRDIYIKPQIGDE